VGLIVKPPDLLLFITEDLVVVPEGEEGGRKVRMVTCWSCCSPLPGARYGVVGPATVHRFGCPRPI
jgi:hypothetical protein